jgi:hypothetical protein
MIKTLPINKKEFNISLKTKIFEKNLQRTQEPREREKTEERE